MGDISVVSKSNSPCVVAGDWSCISSDVSEMVSKETKSRVQDIFYYTNTLEKRYIVFDRNMFFEFPMYKNAVIEIDCCSFVHLSILVIVICFVIINRS